MLNLLEELQERLGLTYLVIAHDLAVVRHISDVVAVMYLGGIVEQAPADELYDRAPAPVHARADVGRAGAGPRGRGRRERILLRGDLPSPADPPAGCRFHTRCPFAQPERCSTERPALRELSPGHTVACHFAEQIAAGTLTAATGLGAPV